MIPFSMCGKLLLDFAIKFEQKSKFHTFYEFCFMRQKSNRKCWKFCHTGTRRLCAAKAPLMFPDKMIFIFFASFWKIPEHRISLTAWLFLYTLLNCVLLVSTFLPIPAWMFNSCGVLHKHKGNKNNFIRYVRLKKKLFFVYIVCSLKFPLTW